MSAKKLLPIFGLTLVLLMSFVGPVGAQGQQSPQPAYLPGSGVMRWKQVNTNGFGDTANGLIVLEVFNDRLYAGAGNWGEGAQIWRSPDGRNWSQVSTGGFGSGCANAAITDLQTFNGKLYAGTGWCGQGGQLWRSANGTDWVQVVDDAFSDPNSALWAMTVFKNVLYVGVGQVMGPTPGLQIWRSSTGNNGSWTNVVTGGLGDPNYHGTTGWATFNGYLYAAVEAASGTGAGILRTRNGKDWAWSNLPGFGDTNNNSTGGFAIYNGYLYIGTNNTVTGGQIWRSGNGSTWKQVMGNGFGDINNNKIESLYTFGGNLFAGTDNSVSGTEIWCSSNGTSWHQVNPDGFGTINNVGMIWNSSVTTFKWQLYYGTNSNTSSGQGAQVWQMIKP